MKNKEKKYFSVIGLFIDKPSKANSQDQYEEKIILVKALDENEAEILSLKYFEKFEDDDFIFLNKIEVCPLFDKPKNGKEIFWRRRISKLSAEEYESKYWGDGKPLNCEDENWAHSWFNLDGVNSGCYNCSTVKKGNLRMKKKEAKDKTKMKTHNYEVKIEWTGNEGKGTLNYKSYNRNHEIIGNGKYDGIKGSSDPSFLGDKTRYNPEDLFLSSLSACHMLFYLHLCAVNKIIVTEYLDNATGIMEESKSGSGKFTKVTLHPKVTITDKNMIEKANELHKKANELCFIANSCNFKIDHKPVITVG